MRVSRILCRRRQREACPRKERCVSDASGGLSLESGLGRGRHHGGGHAGPVLDATEEGDDITSVKPAVAVDPGASLCAAREVDSRDAVAELVRMGMRESCMLALGVSTDPHGDELEAPLELLEVRSDDRGKALADGRQLRSDFAMRALSRQAPGGTGGLFVAEGAVPEVLPEPTLPASDGSQVERGPALEDLHVPRHEQPRGEGSRNKNSSLHGDISRFPRLVRFLGMLKPSLDLSLPST